MCGKNRGGGWGRQRGDGAESSMDSIEERVISAGGNNAGGDVAKAEERRGCRSRTGSKEMGESSGKISEWG